LFSGRSLLRESYERAVSLLPPRQVHVITNEAHLPFVSEELPEVPATNLIGEPVGRDTANAVALASAIVRQNDPEAVVGIFTADHIITPIEQFRQSLERAYRVAEEDPTVLVTMGVKPSRPDTNYGYIWRGEQLGDDIYRVRQFKEKPDPETAVEYVSSGEYYWNSGMFVWRASTILGELKKNLRASHEAALAIAVLWPTEDAKAEAGRLYPRLEKTSIDYAVMERAAHVAVVELDCRWVDVGSWPALTSVVDADAGGNVSACERVIHLDSQNNIVASEEEHLIATVGVEDLVIIHSPDATLVCKRDDTTRLKELVETVKAKYGETHL
jgi:mannose-1-phosphate guanylyltransferase